MHIRNTKIACVKDLAHTFKLYFSFFIFSDILIFPCPSQMPFNMMNQLVPEPTNESLRRA